MYSGFEDQLGDVGWNSKNNKSRKWRGRQLKKKERKKKEFQIKIVWLTQEFNLFIHFHSRIYLLTNSLSNYFSLYLILERIKSLIHPSIHSSIHPSFFVFVVLFVFVWFKFGRDYDFFLFFSLQRADYWLETANYHSLH